MNSPERHLARAVRLTPREDRPRYEAEWRADVARAAEAGVPARDVARGALRMALRLRLRHAARILLGWRGALPAAASWACVAVVVAFPLTVIPLVLMLAFGLALCLVAGTPSRWAYWLRIVSLAALSASGAYVWWAWGVEFTAVDAIPPLPVPPAARYGGAGLVIFLLSLGGLVVSVFAAVAREHRLRAAESPG